MTDAEARRDYTPDDLQVLRDMRRAVDETERDDEGLRERKKRLTRQRISDTATGMFIAHGFDEVRVADVAVACGVSEKTVYNYFPTKESLLLDREPDMIEAVQRALGPGAPDGSPVHALAEELVAEIDTMTRAWAKLPDSISGKEILARFHFLIRETPSLRAAQRDMMDRVAQVAAEALATRAGVDPSEPEPQIAAVAICSLWGVMHRAMLRHIEEPYAPEKLRRSASDEVRRAARLIDTGLWSFGLEVQGTTNLQQVKQAAEAANEARKQVMVAVKAAKQAWTKLNEEARAHRLEQAAAYRRGGWADGRGAGGGGRGAGRVGRGASTPDDLHEEVHRARREVMKAKSDLKAASREAARATADLRDAAREVKRKR